LLSACVVSGAELCAGFDVEGDAGFWREPLSSRFVPLGVEFWGVAQVPSKKKSSMAKQ